MVGRTIAAWARRGTAALILAGALVGAGALALADPPKAGFAPDPPVLASRKQWVFEIAYRGGKATMDRARPLTLASPAGSARMMGRFAVELYVGRELLGRVRFNVPLTAEGPPEKSHRRTFGRPTFENVNTRVKVQIADNPRATYALLVDRATGETQRVAWPPEDDGRLVPMTPVPAATAPSPGDDARAPKAGGDAGAQAAADASAPSKGSADGGAPARD